MAGSIYLRFGPNSVGSLSANQWAPALDAHDPNPPLQIDLDTTQRAPIFQPRWPPRPLVVFEFPNLLLSTLGTPAAMPPGAYDWAIPKLRRAQAFDVGVTALALYATPAAMPPGNYDWAIPAWQRRQAFDVGVTALALYAPRPVTGYDWALPRRAPAPLEHPWPNLTLYLPAPVAPPGPYDWPLPSSARRTQFETTWPNIALLTGTAGAMPPPPYEWPMPQLVRRFIAEHQPNIPVLALVSTPPRSAFDWVMPVRPVVQQPLWAPNLVLTTVFVQQEMPPKSWDWPNPVWHYYHASTLTIVSGMNPAFIPPPPAFTNYVWIHRARRRGNR